MHARFLTPVRQCSVTLELKVKRRISRVLRSAGKAKRFGFYIFNRYLFFSGCFFSPFRRRSFPLQRFSLIFRPLFSSVVVPLSLAGGLLRYSGWSRLSLGRLCLLVGGLWSPAFCRLFTLRVMFFSCFFFLLINFLLTKFLIN